MALTGSDRLTSLAIASTRNQNALIEAERAKYEMAMREYEQKQERAASRSKKKSTWGTVGSLVGGIGGAVLGSIVPGVGTGIGAMAGAGLGGALGGMVGGGLATGDYSPGPMQEQMMSQIPQSLMMYYLYGRGAQQPGAAGMPGGPRMTGTPLTGGYAPSINMTPRPSMTMLGSGGY